MRKKTGKKLLVLDQWASNKADMGTSKNWLYQYFNTSFNCEILNADTPLTKRFESGQCFLKAALTAPFNLRKQYHRNVECLTKYPASFKARTVRFEKAIAALEYDADAIFQIGSLFGPLSVESGHSFSYHDQTVSIVERYWPQWLPRNFKTFRNDFYELEKQSLQTKSLVFTYSDFTRRFLIEDYGIEADRVIVAPTACKIDFPKPDEILKIRKPKIIFISTDFYRKGGDIVIKAFEKMIRKDSKIQLVILGGAFDTVLPDGAVYKGVVSHQILKKELLSASVIVHPARHDAFPNVLKEAIACGCPVVASNSAGIPEIVTHGKTGTVINDPDADSVAEAIMDIINDKGKIKTMREHCVQERDRFGQRICSERIISAIQEVMG